MPNLQHIFLYVHLFILGRSHVFNLKLYSSNCFRRSGILGFVFHNVCALCLNVDFGWLTLSAAAMTNFTLCRDL